MNGRRRRRRQWPLLVVGIALVVLPVVIGAGRLDTTSPERLDPAGVGYRPPVPARTGCRRQRRELTCSDRGVAIGLTATVKSCNEPVDAVVVVAGTAEYWHDQRARLGSRADFVLALPDVAGEPSVFAGTAASEVIDPLDAPLRPTQDVRLTATVEESPHGITVVRGRVERWRRSLAPIVARFRGDWVERTGLGTCIVRMPAVEGAFSVLAAQEALGHAAPVGEVYSTDRRTLTVFNEETRRGAVYRPQLDPTLSQATVVVQDGSVDVDESLPGPDTAVSGNPTWTCHVPPRRVGLLTVDPTESVDVLLGTSQLGSAGALSRRGILHRPSEDCSGMVAVREASASWQRDLHILIIGVLVSLGAAILVEVGLDFYRGRGSSYA